MQNLLTSTDIGTVFLDNDMNVERCMEQAKDLVMPSPTDVGRPISELVSSLKIDTLIEDCRGVLKPLVYGEAEVETRDGGCYLMRIMPYRTAENRIDGLVLTFVNIGRLRRIEQENMRTRAYYGSIVDTARELPENMIL